MPFKKEYIRDDVAVANEILKGEFLMQGSVVRFSVRHLERIDWDMSPETSESMQLNMQALKPVSYLATGYAATHKKKYLSAARGFIDSWLAYDAREGAKNYYAWYNHTVSERLETLLKYVRTIYTNVSRLGEEYVRHACALTRTIYAHVDWLADDAHYSSNHNHGIKQDKALLSASFELKNSEKAPLWRKKAHDRLGGQIDFAFSENGIHLENSAQYHLNLLVWIRDIRGQLAEYDPEYAASLETLLKKAEDYIIYILQPDGSTVALGDSFADKAKLFEYKEAYYRNSERLRYLTSLGSAGEKPEGCFKAFMSEGYAFFRQTWDPRDASGFYATFRSGFSSVTHKHIDDNSFTIFAGGNELFIDPGMYAYREYDAMRMYVTSALAHNMLVVDREPGSANKKSVTKAGLFAAGSAELYDYAAGFNCLNDGVEWDRWFYWIRPNAVLIFDDVVCAERHSYEQLFHLSELAELKKLDAAGAELEINGHRVSLRQLLPAAGASAHTGNGELPSFVSRKLDSAEPTTTLSFERGGDSVRFVTFIGIDGAEAALEGDAVACGGAKIALCPRKRTVFGAVSTEYPGNVRNKFIIRAELDAPEGTTYSWYIYDALANTRVACHTNLPTTEFAFKLPEEVARVTAVLFAHTPVQTIRRTVGVFRREGNALIAEDIPASALELKIRDKRVEQLSERRYAFRFTTDYFGMDAMKSSVWHIVDDKKNVVKKKAGAELIYTFTEPGSYAIYYFAENFTGEMLREQFKSVIIH